MYKFMKKITSFILAIIFSFNITVMAIAAESSVTYTGGELSFEFEPGSQYTETDLFDGFKNVMPGDQLTETIVVKNISTDSDYVNIYMRAETHDESDNPLTYSEEYENTDGKDQADIAGQRDETVASMRDFLSQLRMSIYNNGSLIYEAEPDELGGFAENVLLGTFYPGESVTLTVELEVPITLGNEYAKRVGEVDWVFLAEEINEEIPEEPSKKVDVIIDALKLFNGIPALPGTFGFVLVDDKGEIVDTTANGIFGRIQFNQLTFDEPGVYHYQMREIVGINPTIVYDDTVYDIYITVTEDEDGLEAYVSIKQSGLPYKGIPTFCNKSRKPVDVDLGADKLLDGVFPADGQFEFALVDENGEVIQTVTNGQFGQIDFESLTFNAPGIYKYKIVEIAGDDENIIYDETEYEVIITVTSRYPFMDGYDVKVEIIVNGEVYTGNIIFNNTTVSDEPDNPDVPDDPDEPDNPDVLDDPDNPGNSDDPDTPEQSDTVKTGDEAEIMMYITWILVSAFVILFILVSKCGKTKE